MSITAKTVIFDISSHYEVGYSYTAVRSIEFYLGSVRIDLTSSDFTAYATSYYSSSYLPRLAFDTTLSKIGSYDGKEWLTSGANPQRLIIVFNTEQTFDKLVINNSHDSTNVKGGIRDVAISYSLSEETEINPSIEIESANFILSIEVALHSYEDEEDPQDFFLINAQISGILKDTSDNPLTIIEIDLGDGVDIVEKGEMIAPVTQDLTIYQGASFTAQWSMSSIDTDFPYSISEWSARMQIRTKVSSEDFLLELTTKNGGVDLTNTAEGSFINIYIPPTDTENLSVGGVYDLELVDPAGDVLRLLSGKITVSLEVTR